MTKKLQGKVALVTGASKGIGAAIAKQLAADGAKVIVNYASSKQGAEKVVNEIKKAGGDAVAIQANVAHDGDIQRLVSDAVKAFGKLDILVNNAGVYELSSLEEITSEHFRKMFDLNVLGLILTSQAATKHFGPEGGSIINISSLASFTSPANFSVYSATKAAVDAITKSLGKELGPRKIRVNSINPGLIITEGVQTQGFDGEFLKNYQSQTPLGRVGLPEDIAPAVAFLASDDAAWITGETLVISGGMR